MYALAVIGLFLIVFALFFAVEVPTPQNHVDGFDDPAFSEYHEAAALAVQLHVGPCPNDSVSACGVVSDE